jgi:hypothetical protein
MLPSSHFHATAALPLRNESLAPIEQQAGWAFFTLPDTEHRARNVVIKPT